MRWIWMIVAALAAWATPTAARAERFDPAPVFATSAVNDMMLDATRGGQALFGALSVGGTTRLLDAQAQTDLRQTGTVGRIAMDFWWSTTGAGLIAASVQAAER